MTSPLDANDVLREHGADELRRRFDFNAGRRQQEGAVLLEQAYAFLGRFVAYPSEHARVAHTLWIAHAHMMDAFFADLLANEESPLDLRFQAAKELAPYVHPRLASTESRSGGMSHQDRLEQLRELLSDDD
jgi:hypothetical protein